METLVIFVVLIAVLGGLAVRLGSDSRPGARSPEQDYAGFGFTWSNSEPEPEEELRPHEVERIGITRPLFVSKRRTTPRIQARTRTTQTNTP
jgi:hypothetical protein